MKINNMLTFQYVNISRSQIIGISIGLRACLVTSLGQCKHIKKINKRLGPDYDQLKMQRK